MTREACGTSGVLDSSPFSSLCCGLWFTELPAQYPPGAPLSPAGLSPSGKATSLNLVTLEGSDQGE